MEQLRWDIKNTQSTIANRGTDKDKELDLTNKGLANMIDEEVNTGTDWGTAAAKLEAAGINTNAGSAADQYLRYRFGQGDNPFAT